MKDLVAFLLVCAGLLPVSSTAQGAGPNSRAVLDGYPRNPDVDLLHYAFTLDLGDDLSSLRGRTEMDVAFRRAGVSKLSLDLVGKETPGEATGMTVTAVREDGEKLAFEHSKGRLQIRGFEGSREGEVRSFVVEYHGVPAQGLVLSRNRHDDPTAFGDNFPDGFRHWLPGLDHPSDKATCEFVVTVPERYQVIANGLQVEESSLEGGRRLFHWRQSVPISTYLMVIGVARFAVQELGSFRGIPLQTWVFAQDREEGFHDFARSLRVLAFFDAHVGPYPYEKLANVQSKTRWGGMENSSAIFYAEGSVNGQRTVENTVVHEIAHQWFGDSVTESDWNHVWLSEGFATYFTHLFNEFTYGRDRMVEDLLRDRQRVTGYFHQNPADAIVDPDIGIRGILSTNTYQKGAWVLHMLRRRVGDDVFWESIRTYYARHRDANALTVDLRHVFEEVSGQDLGTFFRQWIHTPGHPQLVGDWTYDGGSKELVVTLRQVQAGPIFHTPIELGLQLESGRRLETVSLGERAHTFRIPLGRTPLAVELDPETWLLMEAEFGAR